MNSPTEDTAMPIKPHKQLQNLERYHLPLFLALKRKFIPLLDRLKHNKAFFIRNPTLEGSHERSDPAVVTGMVYVGSTDRKLYAYGLPHHR
jgi:hypothetical protein